MAGNAAVASPVIWRRALLLAAALLPLWWGARDAALLVAGTRASADIEWKVRSWGARNAGQRIGYSLRVGEGRYSGHGSVTGSGPAAVVRVRYLSTAPTINAIDNPWWLAGAAAFWLAAAGMLLRLASRKGTSR